MRGTVGSSSVSLDVHMPRDEEQSSTREPADELCLLGHSLPHWRLESSTNSVPSKPQDLRDLPGRSWLAPYSHSS